MKNVVLLSSSYTGSTLLSMLVCSHPKIIGFGDTYNYQFVKLNQTRCTCGASPSVTCPIRVEVEKQMAKSGAAFEWITSNPTPIFDFLRTNRLAASVSRKAVWFYIYRSLPDSVRKNIFSRYYRENRLFMQALENIGDYEYYFDGCKILARLELLRTIFPETKVVHLIKNPNAYLHSYLKREEMNYHRIVNGWIRYNTAAHGFKDILGPDKYRLVTFEELTNAPEESVAHLYRFIGAPERHENFDEWIDMKRIHVIGSKSKNVFKRVEEKAPRWKAELRREQIAFVEQRVAETKWLAKIFPEPGLA